MSSQNPTGLSTSNLHDWPSSILLVYVGFTKCPHLEGLAQGSEPGVEQGWSHSGSVVLAKLPTTSC